MSELIKKQAMGSFSLGIRDCLGTTMQSRECVQPTFAAWAVWTRPWRGEVIRGGHWLQLIGLVSAQVSAQFARRER